MTWLWRSIFPQCICNQQMDSHIVNEFGFFSGVFCQWGLSLGCSSWLMEWMTLSAMGMGGDGNHQGTSSSKGKNGYFECHLPCRGGQHHSWLAPGPYCMTFIRIVLSSYECLHHTGFNCRYYWRDQAVKGLCCSTCPRQTLCIIWCVTNLLYCTILTSWRVHGLEFGVYDQYTRCKMH
jgi:hypothetical protein